MVCTERSAAHGAPTDDRVVRVSRELAVPPAVIWPALTEPDRILEWWTPAGYSTSTRGWSFVRGGAWHFTVHVPNGPDRLGLIQFDDIHPLRRLSFECQGDGLLNMGVPLYTVVTLEETDIGTRVNLTMRLTSSAANLGETVPLGADDSAQQALERLAHFVEERGEEEPDLARTVRAAVDLAGRWDQVWWAWVERPLILWWRPKGFIAAGRVNDLGRGAVTNFAVQDPEGREHEHRVVFQTVEPPHRLVYVHYVDGQPYAHARLTFKETEVKGEPGTEVTLRWSCADFSPQTPRSYTLAADVAEELLARLAAGADADG